MTRTQNKVLRLSGAVCLIFFIVRFYFWNKAAPVVLRGETGTHDVRGEVQQTGASDELEDNRDKGDALVKVRLQGEQVLFIYSAYFDDRAVSSHPHVRLTGMLHRNYVAHLDRLHCHVWLPGSVLSVKAVGHVIWQYFGSYQAVMLSCPLSTGTSARLPIMATVSETRRPEEGSALYVKGVGRPDNGTLAICTKVTYGVPDPVRLVEWIELNSLLGADVIHVYNTSIQGRANDVLGYYSGRRTVALHQHQFPDVLSRILFNRSFPTPDYEQNWELEILSINDCLYTAGQSYLAFIDLDEILFPIEHGSLSGFVLSDVVEHNPDVASFVFRTAVYSDELDPERNTGAPWYLHTVIHNRRTRVDWESPKSVTRRRLCVYHAHHMCFRTPSDFRLRYDVDPEYGHLRHYRKRCRLTGERDKCQRLLRHPQIDRSLERFIPELGRRVRTALLDLGLYKS